MASPWGRRLRPLAVLCALVLVFWGVVSAGSLVAQIVELNEYGWPDEDADGEVFGWTFLYLSAAASGCWVAVWGLFGLAWRPPLHLGLLAVVFAVGLEVAANLVQADYVAQFDRSWSFADQLEWYGDRATFQADGLVGDRETAGFFIALPLVTAWLPVVAWFVVVVSGAGRKRRFVPQYGAPQYAYPQQPYPQQYAQQPYQHQQPHYPQPYLQQYAQQPCPPQQHPQAPYQQQVYLPPQDPPTLRLPTTPPERPTLPYRAEPPDQETQPYPKPTEGS